MNIVGRFLQHLRGCPVGEEATSGDVGLDLDHLYGDALSPDASGKCKRPVAPGLAGGRKRSHAADDGHGRQQRLRDPAPKRAWRPTPPAVSVATTLPLEPCLRAPSPPSSPCLGSNTSDGDVGCSRLCLDGGRRTARPDIRARHARARRAPAVRGAAQLATPCWASTAAIGGDRALALRRGPLRARV